jgi:hypothetical protein
MNWPEACTAGRVFGPVAPDGHPQREACEAQFMEAPCPYFMGRCTGVGAECPITYDPYFVIGGVNQNHPRNRHCGEEDWVKVDGHVINGTFWLASAHGKGHVIACNADQSVCTKSGFTIDQ